MTMMRGAFKYVALGLFAYFIIIAAQHFAIQSKTPSRDVYYDAPNENAMSHAHDAPPQDGPSQLRRFSLGRDGRDPHEDRLASDSSRTNSGAKKDPMPSLLSMGTSLRDQQTVTNAFKGRAVLKEEITMLSHGTVSKLSRMLTQLQLWTGPASIAVYLQSQEETLKFHDFVSRNEHELQNAAFHLYYEEAVSPEGEARFYPYNILRNLALNQLESDYFFAVDVDFVTPLEGGYEKLKLLVQQDPEVQARLHSKTFLVLPAFEDKQGVSEENAVSELPRTKDELVRRLQPNGGTMIGFRMDDFPKGHAPTKYDRWSKCTHPLYDIEYGFKFEPYVIGYNRGLPQYWPDFRYSFHFNKYSWFLEAHYSGFKYAVLCDHYVIHLEHSVESKKGGNMEESVNQWRKFKQYLMDRYGAPRKELRDMYGFQGDEPFKGPISKKSALSINNIPTERKNVAKVTTARRDRERKSTPRGELRDSYGHLPPGHITFEVSKRTVKSGLFEDFAKSYKASEYGEGPNRARRSDSGKFCFVDNPHCQAVAEIPEVVSAVRSVLGMQNNTAPLFIWGVKMIKGWAGREHSLHTDMEFAVPECGRLSGATAYVVLERHCDDPSFLRLFSGSHELDFIADEELARLGCWSEGISALPCDTEAVMEGVKWRYNASIPNLEVVDGPRRPYEAVVWPSTAWHMTKDTCDRKVLILQYTNSLACAKSLRYKRRESVLGEYYKYPELYPFQPIGSETSISPSVRMDYAPEVMDHLWLPKPTLQMLNHLKVLDFDAGNCETLIEDQRRFLEKKVKTVALPVDDDIYVSGGYELNKLWNPPMGIGLVPKHPWVKSKTLAVHCAMAVYFANRTEHMAHGPHVEVTDEVCVGMGGRVNYVMSGRADCSQSFDAISAETRQVVFIPSGIAHTNSPDNRDDGEAMCFKFFPYKGSRRAAESGDAAARTSRFASRAASNIIENWPRAGEEIDLFYFRDGSAVRYEGKGREFKTLAKNMPTPGYKRLKAKIYHFAAGEVYDQHADSYDLIAFSLNGTVEITREGNKTPSLLPKHQYAFVPAQVVHGISASHGDAEILFIEIETESKKSSLPGEEANFKTRQSSQLLKQFRLRMKKRKMTLPAR